MIPRKHKRFYLSIMDNSQQIPLQPQGHRCLGTDNRSTCLWNVDIEDGFPIHLLGGGFRSQGRDKPRNDGLWLAGGSVEAHCSTIEAEMGDVVE